jgi:hypothetical protein
MYTKKEMCELYLRSIAKEYMKMNLPINLEDIPENLVINSSIAGVCMEYLGLLKDPEYIKYTKTRAGTLLVSTHEDGTLCVVSFREMIESLPEEI